MLEETFGSTQKVRLFILFYRCDLNILINTPWIKSLMLRFIKFATNRHIMVMKFEKILEVWYQNIRSNVIKFSKLCEVSDRRKVFNLCVGIDLIKWFVKTLTWVQISILTKPSILGRWYGLIHRLSGSSQWGWDIHFKNIIIPIKFQIFNRNFNTRIFKKFSYN